MSRWGLTIPLAGMRLPEQRKIISELPDLGYTDIWSAETNGADAFTPLALAPRLWALVVWLAGLTAVVFLWRRASSAYFRSAPA